MALPEDGEITSISLTVAEYRSLLDNLVSDVAKGYTEYNSGRPYDKGSVVLASDYWPYISQVDNNSGNDPLIDDGTNWRIDDKALTVFAAMFTQGVQSSICRLIIGTTVDSYSYGIFSDNDGYTLWDLSGETGTLTGSFNKNTGTASGMSGTAVRVDGLDPNDLGTAAYADLTTDITAFTGVLQSGDGGVNSKISSTITGSWEGTLFDGVGCTLPTIVLRDNSSGTGPTNDFYFPQVMSYDPSVQDAKTIIAWPLDYGYSPQILHRDGAGIYQDWMKMFTSVDVATSSEINSFATGEKVITSEGLGNSEYGFTVGQTRTEFTVGVDRSQGVTYTNTDSVARFVTIETSHSANNTATLNIAGVTSTFGSIGGNTAVTLTTSFIVLSGETYSISGASILDGWTEVKR